MPYALTLRLDPDSAAVIEAMWQLLANQGLDSDRAALGYAPHITLAIYPDTVAVDALLAGLARVTETWRALPVAFSGFGIFPGATCVLWLAPVVTSALLARHAMVCDALPELPIHPHYRRDGWVPHVTLSGALSDPARAIAALQPLWQPITGTLERADIVRFRPIEVLRSTSLLPINGD